MRIRVHALVTLLLFLSVAVVVCQRPVFATTISFASGAGVTPPTGGSIVDPNVEVSLDNGATWTPAYAADNTGLWPAPFPGSNWDTPSANREQGYGDPQYIQYRISFVLPNGFINPTLSGLMAADDQSSEVSLNGASIAFYPYPGYIYDPSPHAFGTTDSSLFVAGTNVVVFTTLNLGGATGVDFTGTVSGIQGPTNADQCRNGGWRTFGVFRNQGDCVSFVATGGHNPPRG